jgi:multidrug efflux pump subunit AcrA (membrane-fusion protein)
MATPPPPPEVVIAQVIQKDVPLYSEWVGTTEGFVNAQIHPKISGYLLKQNYKDGDRVTSGELLFQIDDREYKAALDQALGAYGQDRQRGGRTQDHQGRRETRRPGDRRGPAEGLRRDGSDAAAGAG